MAGFNRLDKDNCKTRREALKFWGLGAYYIRDFTVFGNCLKGHASDDIQSILYTLQWCHNECDVVSNHQPHDCLLDCLFRRRSKKTSKLRVTGLCAWNSPVTGEFPAQKAINAENVSFWWRLMEYLGVPSVSMAADWSHSYLPSARSKTTSRHFRWNGYNKFSMGCRITIVCIFLNTVLLLQMRCIHWHRIICVYCHAHCIWLYINLNFTDLFQGFIGEKYILN